MARMLPNRSIFSHKAAFNNSTAEMYVYRILQKNLSNEYVVFHSLKWLNPSQSEEGESDFIIMHPHLGLLVIEIKGGEIRYENNQWFQRQPPNDFCKIDPALQARKNQAFIWDLLLKNFKKKKIALPLVGRAICFPQSQCPSGKLPLSIPPQIILDEVACQPNTIESRLRSIFSFWHHYFQNHTRKNKPNSSKIISNYTLNCNLSPEQVEYIIHLLAPTFNLFPSLHQKIQFAEKEFFILTENQQRVFNGLRENTIAEIKGIAGTGKTLLAREKAKELATAGASVLFLCFNSLLKDYLRNRHKKESPSLTIAYHNYHSLAHSLELAKSSCTSAKLLEKLETYIQTLSPQYWPYQHIVIDEAQDAQDKILRSLHRLTLQKQGFFYVFYDQLQNVHFQKEVSWLKENHCKFTLSPNCRNTQEIFTTYTKLIPLSATQKNFNFSSEDITQFEPKTSGEQPNGFFVTTTLGEEKPFYQNTLTVVEYFVKRALQAGISPDSLAIVTLKPLQQSVLHGVKCIANETIAEDKLEDNTILFTTAKKIKGLEAKAVILIDINPFNLLQENKQRDAYVASSRACHLLTWIIQDTGNVDKNSFLEKYHLQAVHQATKLK